MVSTYTPSIRLNKQSLGSNTNTWGLILNSGVFELVDTAIAGEYAFTLSGTVTLTSVNGATDQSRNMMLRVTGGTGGTITIPAVTKLYQVTNGASNNVIVTAGGTGVTLSAGETTFVMCDGTTVRKINPQGYGTPLLGTDVANKDYVDAQAFGVPGTLPGITAGTANQFVSNNGTAAGWSDPLPYQPGNTDLFLATTGVDRTGGVWRNPFPSPPLAGYSLVYNGVANAWEPSGLQLISTVTASNSATVDIDNTFNSTYDEYLITVSGLIPVSTATTLRVRFKIAGSYSTSSLYEYHSQTSTSASAAYAGVAAQGSTFLQPTASIGVPLTGLSMDMRIHRPTDTAVYKNVTWHGAVAGVSGLAPSMINGFGTYLQAGQTLSGVRFFMDSGNINSGVFRLYGFKK